jgi:acyl-CoA thioester hydrolase
VHKARLHVHTSLIPIRWGDMDAFGHVNNTVYFRYMEQTRVDWIDAAFPARGEQALPPLVIVNASCTFQLPLVYPGTVEVRMLLSDPGRTSVGSFYEMWMGDRRYAEGAAKMVFVDPVTGRPAPLPESVAAPLRALAP